MQDPLRQDLMPYFACFALHATVPPMSRGELLSGLLPILGPPVVAVAIMSASEVP